MKNGIDIKIAIQNLKTEIKKTRDDAYDWIQYGGNDWMDPSWKIEICFWQLLIIVEVLELVELRKLIELEYFKIKEAGGDFSKTEKFDDEYYCTVLARISHYLEAIENMYSKNKSTIVEVDLIRIIKDINYVITDSELFGSLPKNEMDVHRRIEGILKPVFPELKHKPMLTKQIKNFEPDTGIPSCETLLEYKYITNVKDAKRVVDEILTDIGGYKCKEWKKIIFVIYETSRIKPESDWRQLLKEADVSDNISIVVLYGENPKINVVAGHSVPM